MNTGKRLQEIRESKNMSIYKLSQLSEVSEAHIRNLENSKKDATVETLHMLVQCLGFTMSEFFNEDNSVTYLTAKEKVLLDYFRMLPEDTVDAVIEFCKKLHEQFNHEN